MMVNPIDAINFESISFNYGSLPVLKKISFDIQQGDFVGILGPNGAGKTTILKILEKLLKPKQGNILINKEDLQNFTCEKIAKTIGYIPQNQGTSFPTTVFDTILMGRKPHFKWNPTKRDRAIVSRIIGQLGLSDLALRSMDEMSGGQRQKVFFGRILAQNPDVLLLDEPTANLDMKHQLEILSLLRNLAKEGKTIIMAIHDLNLALKYCDTFVMLHESEIVCSGGEEIITEESIRKIFEVEVHIQRDPQDRKFLIPESLSCTLR